MSLNPITEKPKKFFYGWWVVAASMVIHTLTGLMYTYGFSAFFLPICNEFGWKRAVMSGPIGVSRLEGGLLGPVEGYLADRFGPRKLMLVGAVLVGVAFILLSRIQSLAMFYVVLLVFLGFGAGLLGVGIVVAVVNWFHKRRTLGLGIAMGGVQVGAMSTPFVVWLIATRGWRSAAFILGIVALVVLIPLSLVMRHRPERYGYLPDGMTEEQAKAAAVPSKEPSGTTEQYFTPMQAIRTRTFWIINLAYGCRMLIVAAIPIHLIPFIQDIGYSAEKGATIMALMGFFALASRIGVGFIADVIPKRYAFAACMVMLSISAFFLSTVHNMWQLGLWAVIYAPGYGGSMPIMGAMVGDYYGRKYFGTINGLTHIVMSVSTLAGPVVAGYVFDVTGSYRLAFVIFAAVAAVAAVCGTLATRPRPPATRLAS